MTAAEVHEPTTAALVPFNRQEGSLVRPAAPIDAIEVAFREYSALCERLLEPSDFQRIGDKDFRKKSAWRKLSVAYGVSTELISKEYERNEQGRIIRAEVVMRATAPNGRYQDGLGACDLFEKCCQPNCRKGGNHRHCAPDCPGSIHFSNPQHDLPATAMTRATNRAQSDLFGLGEVSAEEITDRGPRDHDQPHETDWFVANGWEGGKDEHDGSRAILFDKLKALPAEALPTFKAWREDQEIDISKALTHDEWSRASAEADRLVSFQARSPSPSEDATGDETEVLGGEGKREEPHRP